MDSTPIEKPLNPKEIYRMSQGLAPWESLSFACGGWLQFYLFGVARALQASGLTKGVKYCGCSAGALAAAGLVIEGDFDAAIKFCKDKCLPDAYAKYDGLFKLSSYVTDCIEVTLAPKYFDIPPDVLQIATTKLPFFTAERVKVHPSYEELVKAILASCAAAPFAGLVYRTGAWYIDGGLSEFQPIVDENTITVSPLYFSDCDIKPSRYVPLWWSFLPPRSEDTVDWLYTLGWNDCLEYLKSRDIQPMPGSELKSYPKKSHPYDIPRRVRSVKALSNLFVSYFTSSFNYYFSLYRFLGYDVGNLTNNFVSFLMDFILLVLLVVVLRPLALVLIYIELFLRIIFLSTLSVCYAAWDISPPRVIHDAVKEAYKTALSNLMRFGYMVKLPESAKISKNTVSKQLWDCVTCIFSLSLLLRFLTGPPSQREIRKHNRLAKQSLLYRLFRHFI